NPERSVGLMRKQGLRDEKETPPFRVGRTSFFLPEMKFTGAGSSSPQFSCLSLASSIFSAFQISQQFFQIHDCWHRVRFPVPEIRDEIYGSLRESGILADISIKAFLCLGAYA